MNDLLPTPLFGLLGFLFIIPLGLFVLMVVSLWTVFTKAGEPGWGCLIPFYNLYLLCRIGGKPWWYLLLLLVPVVNLVIVALICVGVARNFGRSGLFGIGLWLLPILFYPILAFSDAAFEGGNG